MLVMFLVSAKACQTHDVHGQNKIIGSIHITINLRKQRCHISKTTFRQSMELEDEVEERVARYLLVSGDK